MRQHFHSVPVPPSPTGFYQVVPYDPDNPDLDDPGAPNTDWIVACFAFGCVVGFLIARLF